MNKYLYVFVVQGLYDYKFTDLFIEKSFKEAELTIRDYRRNERNIFRIVRRRIPNSEFK